MGEERERRLGEFAEGEDAETVELFLGGITDIDHGLDGERPDFFFEIILCDYGCGVGFFHVGGEFGKDFIKAHADGGGYAEFEENLAAEAVGDILALAKKRLALGDIEPAFVEAEAFYPVGVALVDLFGEGRIVQIGFVVGLYADETGAFLFGLPDDIAGLHAEGFCAFIFSQDDAVAQCCIAAYGDGLVAQRGIAEAFDGGIKIIEIAVEDDSLHGELRFLFFKHMFYNKYMGHDEKKLQGMFSIEREGGERENCDGEKRGRFL